MEDDTPDDSSADDGPPIARARALEFHADPRNPARLVWMSPAGPARLAAARAVVFGAATLLFLAAGPTILATTSDVGVLDAIAIVALCVLFAAGTAALALHYGRDARGRRRSVIVLHERHIEFDLAAHRSLTEPSPRDAGRVYYNDVTCLETRVEVYRVLGIPLCQRKFRLVPRTGEPVLLFEDREWSTDAEASHATLATTIAARARVSIRDRGVVPGESAFLGIIGARAPGWQARSDG